MNYDIEKFNFEHSWPESLQLKLARRWVEELKGGNRGKAVDLMKQIAEGKITSEEALELLDITSNRCE